MRLDLFTFGDTEPAIWLVDKLNALNSEKVTRSVSVVINKSNTTINAISTIKDAKARVALAILYKKDIHERVNDSKSIPDELKSRICNVLITKLTCIIRNTNELEGFWKAVQRSNGFN